MSKKIDEFLSGQSEWLEVPVDPKLYSDACVWFEQMHTTKEEAISLFIKRCIEQREALLTRHNAGQSTESIIAEVSDAVIKEIVDRAGRRDDGEKS